MTQTHDHEKLSKIKFNGNETTTDDLDYYEKCILHQEIEHEKLTSVKKEEEELKTAKSWTPTST